MLLNSEYPEQTDPAVYGSHFSASSDSNPSRLLMLDRLKILVVDDEPDTRRLLKALLELYGAEVVLADSGNSAIREFSYYQPQVLITDISLADFDGFELLKKIRAQERVTGSRAASIPAIAISGYGGEMRRKQALLAGFFEYLTKPCNPGQLLATMSSISRRKQRFDS